MTSHDFRHTEEGFDASTRRAFRNWAKSKEPSSDVRKELLMKAAVQRALRRPSWRKAASEWVNDIFLGYRQSELSNWEYERIKRFPRGIIPVLEMELAMLRLVF